MLVPWTEKKNLVVLMFQILLISLLLVSHSLAFSPSIHRVTVRTPTTTSLNVNVAASLIRDDMDGGASSSSPAQPAGPRLTRPERKALEREKKARRNNSNHRRKHNFADRSETLRGKRAPGEGRYDLHSNLVSTLTKDSSAEDVIKAIKRAQNLHDGHDIRAIERFLLEEAPPTFAYGYFGSLLSRLAVAAMHMDEQELARKALDERHAKFAGATLPMESAAIIRGLLRVHNVTDALAVLHEELALPTATVDLDTDETREIVRHRALSLASIASRHFYEFEPTLAVRACEWLAEVGPVVRQAGLTAQDVAMPWARVIQGAAQCEAGRREGKVTTNSVVDHDVKMPCNLVYSVLNAMTTFPSVNDDRTYENLSNALIRRVVFVTGAVDMDGCPQADRGEAAFIGRSNVGKSSLVNMITNRKSLAYTSKTPGKTQQFNFFAVNDKPDKEREIRFGDDIPGEKDPDSLYLVDLPGFGFAKVPDKIRRDWSNFMTDYIQTRRTLRVVFHLVDSRHGPTREDEKIMAQIGQNLPKSVTYVVVLTKSDKNIKGVTKKNEGKVSRKVMDALRLTMKSNKLGNSPVILTSAETKLGRDDLWRYLRRAAEA